MLAEMKKNK